MNHNTPLVLTENSVLIAKYSNYEAAESGDYDLSILATTPEFIEQLEKECVNQKYKKYDFCSENMSLLGLFSAYYGL